MNNSQLVLLSIFNRHPFAVSLTPHGHYCGYVRLNDDESDIFKRAKEEYPFVSFLNCHGGITFVDEEDGSWILPPGKWVGFDCGHHGDGIDLYALETIFGKSAAEYARTNYFGEDENNVIKPKQVAAMCKDIIGQIIEMKGGKAPEKKYTIELTKDQLYNLSYVIDNEALMADAFFNPETGMFDTYNENGEDIHITPQEYLDTRLATIECK